MRGSVLALLSKKLLVNSVGMLFDLLEMCIRDRANGQSLFFTALTAAAVLVLLAQSWALLRTCFGPAWPECLLEDRMPSGALERAEGDNAPGGAGVENHHREDD